MSIKIKKAGNINTTRLIESKAPYIEYDILKNTKFVKNAFSTRYGGVSKGIYESMNFSVKMGDDALNVKENFDIFLKENKFKNPIMSTQTHTANVIRVGKSDIGKGIYTESEYSDVDGLVTNEKDITLVTTYADCVPLYFADTKNKAIGLSHSGWRGTVLRIGQRTLEKLKEEFGTNAKDVVAAIGPSICVNCYEVSEDVAKEFEREFGVEAIEMDDIKNGIDAQNMDVLVYKKGSGKYLLNLWAANYRVLRDAGVKEENIAIPDICTCCNKDIMFSHRGHMGKRGNMCAFLQLTDDMEADI